MTKRLEIRERSPVNTSVRPSLKYSCLGSSLMLTNGSTTSEGLSGSGRDWVLGVGGWVLGEGREKYRTATTVPAMSPKPASNKMPRVCRALWLPCDTLDVPGVGGRS